MAFYYHWRIYEEVPYFNQYICKMKVNLMVLFDEQMKKKSSCCRGLTSCIKRTVDREDPSEGVRKTSPGYTTPGGYQTPMGYHTPGSSETQVVGSVSRCTSLNFIKDQQPLSVNSSRYRNASMMPLAEKPDHHNHQHLHHHYHHLHHHHHHSTGASTLPRTEGSSSRMTGGGKLQARSHSSDSVYTILIRLPHEPTPDGPLHQPTILMIEEEAAAAAAAAAGGGDGPNPAAIRAYHRNTAALARRGDSVCSDPSGSTGTSRNANECSLHPGGPGATSPGSSRRPPLPPNDIKLPLNAKIIPKQLAKNSGSGSSNTGTATRKKKKKKTSEKKQDRKAAKTLSAILLAFIITWTPYNVMVLINPILKCQSNDCIPEELWNFGYYLCYVNSMINPMLYALCNASFRRTYVRILTCKWHNRKRQGVQRGFYSWELKPKEASSFGQTTPTLYPSSNYLICSCFGAFQTLSVLLLIWVDPAPNFLIPPLPPPIELCIQTMALVWVLLRYMSQSFLPSSF